MLTRVRRSVAVALACLSGIAAGIAHIDIQAACSADNQHCLSELGVAGADVTRRQVHAAASADQVLLQRSILGHKALPANELVVPTGLSCAAEGIDPWSTGTEVLCCEGLLANLEQASDGHWHFMCRANATATLTTAAPPAALETTVVAPAPGPVVKCTIENGDTGLEVQCCNGTQAVLEQCSDGRWHYICRASATIVQTTSAPPAAMASNASAPAPGLAATCTTEGDDPWNTGSEVQCCDGTQTNLEEDSSGKWRYICRASSIAAATTVAPPAASETTAAMPAAAAATASPGGEGLVKMNILNWNVHWTNKDTEAMARVIGESNPDIVGLCEFTASLDDMAAALSTATGRNFAVQPGRGNWQGYGTDILYDQGKWEALEGGVQKVSCHLRDLAHGKLVITGGVHLSYCEGGCDSTHECELGVLYDNLDQMRSKYPNAAIVWMGDLNRDMSTTIVQNLMQGRIGSRATVALDDLAQSQGNTYYTGGSAIDHILGEAGRFERISGGLTGQGVTGQHLSGADHFPVRALVHYE
eukprot:CAMPEP_0115348834 /NCGR_PEP_ID=MMETSP0270-20121206/95606_1 /TAXON_ID=71861 /ORGANISM="Scrippsiella trochoidea, Strain CCMP3099" /LENGTH=530 /DNA_ID=CAMNT_0002770811 /DNA_START=59 /DNA_END=1651 /DNA_ORIENTATION=+